MAVWLAPCVEMEDPLGDPWRNAAASLKPMCAAPLQDGLGPTGNAWSSWSKTRGKSKSPRVALPRDVSESLEDARISNTLRKKIAFAVGRGMVARAADVSHLSKSSTMSDLNDCELTMLIGRRAMELLCVHYDHEFPNLGVAYKYCRSRLSTDMCCRIHALSRARNSAEHRILTFAPLRVDLQIIPDLERELASCSRTLPLDVQNEMSSEAGGLCCGSVSLTLSRILFSRFSVIVRGVFDAWRTLKLVEGWNPQLAGDEAFEGDVAGGAAVFVLDHSDTEEALSESATIDAELAEESIGDTGVTPTVPDDEYTSGALFLSVGLDSLQGAVDSCGPRIVHDKSVQVGTIGTDNPVIDSNRIVHDDGLAGDPASIQCAHGAKLISDNEVFSIALSMTMDFINNLDSDCDRAPGVHVHSTTTDSTNLANLVQAQQIHVVMKPMAGKYLVFRDGVAIHRCGGSPVWDRVVRIRQVGWNQLQLETTRQQRQNPCVTKGRYGWLDVSNIEHKIVESYDESMLDLVEEGVT